MRPWLALLGWLVACSDGTSSAPSPAGGGASGSSSSGSGTSGGTSSGGTSSGDTTTKTPLRPGCKRGVAYGYHSEADLRALSKGISWWYNWAFEPDEKVRDVFGAIGVEYVPMVWGTKVDPKQVSAKMPASSTALLGFNEPNFGAQANLSAKDAAAAWPELQKVADEHRTKLVSPAVNFCGGDCRDPNPFDYLDDFFAACPGCRVDAIGIHIYVGCKGEGGNHAKWMIDHLETYEQRFTKPLWLTEFACNDAKNEDEQRAFLVDAVAYLESDPRIERYAWFAGRADNVPHVDLLGADGQLTALGQAYVDAPHGGGCSP